jgi:hypothetical protein
MSRTNHAKFKLLNEIYYACCFLRNAIAICDMAELGDEFDVAEDILDRLIDFSNQVEQL